MITQKDYDNGIRCKGAGFNCGGCLTSEGCVQYSPSLISLEKLKPLSLQSEIVYTEFIKLVKESSKITDCIDRPCSECLLNKEIEEYGTICDILRQARKQYYKGTI